MAHQPVAEQAFERLQALIEREELIAKDPRLAVAIATITRMKPPSALRDILMARLTQSVQAARQQYKQEPFLPLPPQAFAPPGYRTFREYRTNRPLFRAPIRFASHTCIDGPSGSGKTTIAQTLIHEALTAKLPDSPPPHVKVLDLKADAQHLPVMYHDFLALERDTPWPLLQIPPFQSAADVRATFTEVMCATMYKANRQRAIIIEALRRVFANTDHPSLEATHHEVQQMNKKTETYTYRDSATAIDNDLSYIRDFYSGLYFAKVGLNTERDICRRSIWMGVPRVQTNVEAFIFTYLLHLQLAHNRFYNIRDGLSDLVLVDESLVNLAEDASTISGRAPLLDIFTQIREFSAGLIFTTAARSHTSRVILENAALHITTGTGIAAKDLAAAHLLDEDQMLYAARQLAKGRALLRCTDEDTWKAPVVIAYDPLPYSKVVTPQEWAAVRARTAALMPLGMPGVTSTATPQITQREQKTPRPAPVNPISLNANTRRVLEAIVANPAMPCTFYQKFTGLHEQVLDRSKATLLQLALIEAQPMLVRAGRGGQGMGLRATRKGYDLVGKQPPLGTRGGDSIQHEFLVRSLAGALNVRPELTIGTKSIDLVIPYNPTTHEHFLRALQEHSTPLAPTLTLSEGDLVAVEVEVSDPEKTAPNNVLENHRVGITLNVIATLPKAVNKTIAGLRTTVPESLHARVVVIDALQLLAALTKDVP